MGWLESIKRALKFKCSSCGNTYELDQDNHLSIMQIEDMSRCPHCSMVGTSKYAGFRNKEEIGITKGVQKSTYEKNGRKAVRVGNTFMSKSKYNYLDTGKVAEYYTKEYDEHTVKQEVKIKHQANEFLKGVSK